MPNGSERKQEQEVLDKALFDAFCGEPEDVVKALAAGASVNAVEGGLDERSAFFVLVERLLVPGYNPADAKMALLDEKVAAFTEALLRGGYNPNIEGQGLMCEPYEMERPLHIAVELNCHKTVEVLLAAGADPMAKSRGETAAFFLNPQHLGPWSSQAFVLCARALAATGVDFDAIGSFGTTTLAEACAFSNVDAVEELTRLGASPFIRNSGGQTALHIVGLSRAGEPGESMRCALALLAAGADAQALDDQGAAPAQTAEMGARGAIVAFIEKEALDSSSAATEKARGLSPRL